jgi:hypothetical protein
MTPAPPAAPARQGAPARVEATPTAEELWAWLLYIIQIYCYIVCITSSFATPISLSTPKPTPPTSVRGAPPTSMGGALLPMEQHLEGWNVSMVKPSNNWYVVHVSAEQWSLLLGDAAHDTHHNKQHKEVLETTIGGVLETAIPGMRGQAAKKLQLASLSQPSPPSASSSVYEECVNHCKLHLSTLRNWDSIGKQVTAEDEHEKPVGDVPNLPMKDDD